MKLEQKRKNLIRLGISPEQLTRGAVRGWEDVRQLPDQSPILGTTITVDRLKKRGYVPLLNLYNQVKPETSLFPMT